MSTISAILPVPPDNFSTTLSSGISSSALTIPLNSVSGMGTEGIGVIYSKDSSGVITASTIEFVHWTNISGNNATLTDTGDRGITGSTGGAQVHNSGDTFEVWIHSKYYAGMRTALLNLVNQVTGAPQISDTNSNELLKFTSIASAVNELTLANAATAGNPLLSATGGDTDVGIDVKTKGNGRLRKPTLVEIPVFAPTTDLATGDAKAIFVVPEELNGMNLTGVKATVYTAGTTGTTDIQIRNKTDTTDMLSTKLTIDSTETDTATAATPAVIDTSKDDVVTGDVIAIDVDAISSTAPQGLIIGLRFELP